jgi:group II intron reverse transcriptase/maturase
MALSTIKKPTEDPRSSDPTGTASTRWLDFMDYIYEESKARKKLILEATVPWRKKEGNNTRGLPPLCSVNHFFDVPRVEAATCLLNEEAAPGIDGLTLGGYLGTANFGDLVREVRSRHYWPKPSRRVLIPKPDGSTRPLGIPTVKDRLVQRAWLLAVGDAFEGQFLDCSYGYRPGRNCHQAIQAIATEIIQRGNVWVLDADVKAYFDSVPHDRLMSILRRTIADPVFLTFCERTLKADVMVSGKRERVLAGTPQGGVISPMFANLYLHVVLDVFFHEQVRPQLQGWARLMRYADDFVILCESREDAMRAQALIDLRMQQWGLTLHPTKTSIRNMNNPERHPPRENDEARELQFLGFQLSWQQTAAWQWTLATRTAPGRREKALQRWREALEEMETRLVALHLAGMIPKHIHLPFNFIEDLDFSILAHVYGFTNYYRVEGNGAELCLYEEAVLRDAAAFWRRHSGPRRGANPYEGPRDRIWASIRLRPVCKLSH